MLGKIERTWRRGWQRMNGWMASLNQRTWVWVNSGSWWWIGRPGVLWFMGSQRIGHDWVTEQNWISILAPSSGIFARLLDFAFWKNTHMLIDFSVSSLLFIYMLLVQLHSIALSASSSLHHLQAPAGTCWLNHAVFQDIVHFLSFSHRTSLAMLCCSLMLLFGLGARKGCGARFLWLGRSII